MEKAAAPQRLFHGCLRGSRGADAQTAIRSVERYAASAAIDERENSISFSGPSNGSVK